VLPFRAESRASASINRNVVIKGLLRRATGSVPLARDPLRMPWTLHFIARDNTVRAMLDFMIDVSINNRELSSPMKCDR